MKKGQIIRKKLTNGTPVGPYLKIIEFINKFEEQGVVVEEFYFAKNSKYTLSRKNVYELKTIKLVVSDEIVERILNGRQSAIIHDISKKWCLENLTGAEIVYLRSYKYTNKFIICTVDSTSTVYYNKKPQVRLQLGHIIDHEY